MVGLNNIGNARLRSYSSAFSRSTFLDILRYDDFGHLEWLYRSEQSAPADITYLDYLRSVYRSLVRGYRCEYVYKNEIIHHLIQQYRSKSSVIYNEFRVGTSVADLAFFNGESRAFEIKTEYDSDKRLAKQMQDYLSVFDKCYLVIPEHEYQHYVDSVDERAGIILLTFENGRISFEAVREARLNSTVDVGMLMKCCRTQEYESFVNKRFGALPKVPVRDRYAACTDLLRTLPDDELKSFFLSIAKKRHADLTLLRPVPRCLRQMCLSLNLRQVETEVLVNKLNGVIG